MLMEQVADFVNFLGQRNHSKEEVLVHLALRTFSPLQCNGVVLAELKPSGVMEITAKYGVDDDFFDAHPKRFRLTEQMPITDSIKTRETIWITTLPSWGEDYEQLQSTSYQYDGKTFICWTIEQSGTPYASIGIFCENEVLPDETLESFLHTISNLLALFFYSLSSTGENNRITNREELLKSKDVTGNALTERQLLILKMMAEGRTNLSISGVLGYSESTIRHETIKIYAKLGCTGRVEASNIYQEIYANINQETANPDLELQSA